MKFISSFKLKEASKVFFRGLWMVLPLFVTMYLLYWLVSKSESFFGNLVKAGMSSELYVPGMGLIVLILLIFSFGILANFKLGKKLSNAFNKIINQVPVIKNIYGPTKDLASFLSNRPKDEKFKGRVVLFELKKGIRLMGFMTQNSVKNLSEKDSSPAAVYFPMSYQLGGYTIYVDKEKLEKVDWPIEKAMQFTLTAGISSKGALQKK